MRIDWRVSTPSATFLVTTDDPDMTVVSAAPIARKFVGQQIKRLVDWFMKMHGGPMDCFALAIDGKQLDLNGPKQMVYEYITTVNPEQN